jgi:uroporphyrinogen decarboxylase
MINPREKKSMNSKERVIKAINFQQPDRPPIQHAILPAAQYKYGGALNSILDNVHEDFGWNLLPDLPREKLPPMYKKGFNTDDFGTVWMVETDGICGIPKQCPIADDWSNYDEYSFPEVFTTSIPKYRMYSGHMAGDSPDYYARGAWVVFFEQLQQLHGFEATLMDIFTERPEIYNLRDRLLEFNLAYIDNWLEMDYQGLHFADDWGTQTSLLIPPDKWRSFFKPVYAEMFKKVKDAGLHIWFHSDGNISEIIPDLVELGIDVINCQTSVIDKAVIRQFVGKICFRTDLDRQGVLPNASPQEVKDHVNELFHAIGTPDGGIIANGEIGPDMPLENIDAMYEAFLEFKW